jgi:transcriptional regulator GlxA family with amidase domain
MATWSSSAEDLLLSSFNGIIQAVKSNRPAIQQIMAGTTCRIIGLLYSAQQAPRFTNTQGENVIEKAIVRFQARYATQIDVQELAKELGTSYRSFRSHFTRHTGMSPHQYLIEMRILRGRNLLAETDYKVKEVASQVGFQDEHYFSRLFRSRMGVSPGEWRTRSKTLPDKAKP